METAWIQVFVLTLSECVAPAGKTICQEQALELQFLTRSDCEIALEQLLDLKDESESVIVDPGKSSCIAAARERQVYESLDAMNAALSSAEPLRALEQTSAEPSATQVAHRERLATLKTCEEADGVAPCKIGEIIIEGATDQAAEIWKSD